MTDLKITQQELENRQLRITVEVPQQRVEREMRKLARDLARRYRFPGFRPGKAPYHVVVARVGREEMLDQIVEDMAQDIYQEMLKTLDLEPPTPGSLLDVTRDPLVYEFEVPLPPRIELGDYRSIRVPVELPKEEDIQQLVDEQLETMRERHRSWQTVEEPVGYGDLVNLSIKVTIDDEVVLENDDWDFMPSEDEYTLAPEFDSNIVGLKAGDKKTFAVHFDEKSNAAWRGKDGVVEVSISEVQRQVLPELDDDFALMVSDADSLEELREQLAGQQKALSQAEAEENFERELWERVFEIAHFEFPDSVVDEELEMLLRQQEERIKNYGIESLSEFLRLQNKSEEEFRAELRPSAEERIKQKLVLDEIARREGLQVPESEVQETLDAVAKDMDVDDTRKVDWNAARESLVAHLKRGKALELLYAIARGEEVPAPGEHDDQATETSEPQAEAMPAEAAHENLGEA